MDYRCCEFLRHESYPIGDDKLFCYADPENIHSAYKSKCLDYDQIKCCEYYIKAKMEANNNTIDKE